jgi:hypothetical protein
MKQKLRKLLLFLLRLFNTFFNHKKNKLTEAPGINYVKRGYYDAKYSGSRKYTKAPRIYKI